MGIDAGTIVIRLAADAKGVVQGFGVATGQVKGFKGQMDGISAGMASAGDKMTKWLTLPILAAGAASTKFALDFEQSMTDIEALVGASTKDMATYRAAIMDLAPAVGIGPRELADALYFVTSSGLKGGAALRALRASALASAAGLGDTKTIADAVTSAINAYGEGALSASRATDILLAAVREGKSDPEEFAGSIGRVIPIAQKMGVSFGEVAGIMSAMSLNGTDANEAVTQISAMLASSIKPTKDGAAALKDVGMSYADLRKEIAEKGLTATVADLNEKFHGNIETLGELFPNIRALRGFLALTGAEADKYAGIIDRVSKAHGDAAKASAIALSKPGADLKKAWAEIQVELVETGDILLPFLADGAKLVSGLAKGFGNLSDESKKLVVGLAAAAAVAGPLLSVLARLATIKLACGGAGSLTGIASGAGKATDKVKLLGDAALTTGDGLRGMKVGTVAGFGVIGVAAGSLLVVLGHINEETQKVNKSIDDMVEANTKAINELGAKQMYKAAVEGINGIFKSMADGKLTLREGQRALIDWDQGLRNALASAKKWGTPEMVKGIQELIDKSRSATGGAKEMVAAFGVPMRIHNTEVNAEIAKTKTKISELKDELVVLGKQTPSPRVKADTEECKRKLEEARQRLRELNDEKANPKVTVNNKQAVSAIQYTKWMLGQLHDKTVTLRVQKMYSEQPAAPGHGVGSGTPSYYPGGNNFGNVRPMTYASANPFAGIPADQINLIPPQFSAAWLGMIDSLQQRYEGLLEWAAKIPDDERWKGLGTKEGKWTRFTDFLAKAQDEYQGLLDAAEQVQADIDNLTGTIMNSVALWPQYVETVNELGEKVKELQLPTVQMMNPDDLSKVMDANVANMKAWVANMDKLRAAGLPKELLDELTAMGLGGAGQVAGLASMTAEQLAKWTGGWLELQKLAGEQAKATFKDASDAAVAAIDAFTAALLDALAALGIPKEVGGTVIPGQKSLTVFPQAAGGDYLVTRPTLFLAGEDGIERAQFTPLPGGGARSALPSPSGWDGEGGVYVHIGSIVSNDPEAVRVAAREAFIEGMMEFADLKRTNRLGRGR